MLKRVRQRLIDLPIEKKLMFIIIATSAIVLLISTFAFVANEAVASWHSSLEDLSTTAKIIGANSSAALAFDDETAAAEMLKALAAKPWIEAAYLYDPKGEIFARYTPADRARSGDAIELQRDVSALLPGNLIERNFLNGPRLHLAQAIIIGGDRVGTIHLVKDMQELKSSISRHLMIAAGVILIAGMVAILLATRLQRVVSRPIANMMETVTRVSTTKDYSLRASKYGKDELGCLVDGFNEMLRKIEESTTALEEAKAQAEAANQAKSRFLAHMSHEVRTPLNGVVGMLKLMRMTPLSEQQSRYADTGIVASDALLSVINDILDFSKIEAGHLDLESIDFTLRDVVERVLQMFAERASQKGIEIAALVHHNVPGHVRGDPNRLTQVLINLVGNAIKFTDTGEVVVRGLLEDQNESHVTVRFTVSDTGVGITGEQKARLFQAFSQGDASMTRRFGGTGLGLAISKHLVHLMGGAIGVESKPGAGSTFWFTVRLEKNMVTAAAQEPENVTTLKGLRVLIVDDSATNREILRQQIGSWGCAVTEASNGEDALVLMKNAKGDGRPFAIAVLDGNMPGMNGAELGSRIKTDTSLRDTRLIMLSSMSDCDLERLKAAGFASHLTKPIRQSELHNALITALVAGTPFERNIPETAPLPPLAPRTKAGRILLAEDNDINQMLVLEILRMAGHACECVANGRAAVAAVQNTNYDLVLMDCQMPEMDGYEATRAIRSWESAGADGGRSRRIPIIALTARALAGDREACLAAGMDDYLTKPLDPVRTRQVIEAWLAAADSRAKPEGPAAVSDGGTGITGEKAIDYDALVERCLGNAALAERLIAKYQTQVTADLKDLRDAIQAGDKDRIAFFAHRMKGAAANLSVEGIRGAAAQIESMARGGTLSGIEGSFDTLRLKVELFREFVPCEPARAGP